jgi:hypothetical protein
MIHSTSDPVRPERPAARRITAVAFVGALAYVVVAGRTSAAGPEPPFPLGFRLEDVTAQVGVAFVHSKPNLDPSIDNVAAHVAALGASVSLADIDRDGWQDLYFTTSRFGEPNALYLNDRGTFREAAERLGIADLNRPGEGVSMGSVWGDYDNDGWEDLFVYKYGYLQLLRNVEGRRFQDVTEETGLRVWMNANSAIWVDYDHDGLLDLYVAGYFRSEIDLWDLTSTRIFHDSFEFASNGGANRLFRNTGHRFVDVTEKMGVGSTRWTLAIGAADFDGDGWTDLYLANDYGPEELYLNRTGGGFEPVHAGLRDDSKSGMSVSLGDTENRGRLDVFVTNISERGYLFQGNNLRLNQLREYGRFVEVAEGPLVDAGWAWGAQFGDLNNDGKLELFVTNGFISADPDQDYWYGMSLIGGASGRIIEDVRNWPEIGSSSLSGYERSRLLMRDPAGNFVDVAEAAGVADTYDGRAVALADLFNRGRQDVIVANQRGPALIYRNRTTGNGSWIRLELEGTSSNRSAIGTEVTVEWSGGRLRRVVDGGMGFASQNDRRVHFGLGNAEVADRVTIRWPSGQVQVMEYLEAGRAYSIQEPGEPTDTPDGVPSPEGSGP